MPWVGPVALAEEGDRLMVPIMLVLSAAGVGLLGLGSREHRYLYGRCSTTVYRDLATGHAPRKA